MCLSRSFLFSKYLIALIDLQTSQFPHPSLPTIAVECEESCAQLLSHVELFATLWTSLRQAPLSMGFPRQEYWSGLPLPNPGGSSWPRDQTFCISWVSCLGRQILYHCTTWEASGTHYCSFYVTLKVHFQIGMRKAWWQGSGGWDTNATRKR